MALRKSKTKSINNMLTIVWEFACKIHPLNYPVTPHGTQTHIHMHPYAGIYVNYYFTTTVFQYWVITVTHYYYPPIFDSPESTCLLLHKQRPHSELFWSVFSRIWTEYGEIGSISPYSVRMRENTGHNNSEYKHFSRSVLFLWSVESELKCYPED